MEGNLLGHTSSAATVTSTWHYLLPDTLLPRTILFQAPRDCTNRLLQLGCPCCWPLVDLYGWAAVWPSPEVTLSLCASQSTLIRVTCKPMSPFLFCFFYIHRNLHEFFSPFILISWRPITPQYCSGFCHTLIWISHGFTCVPHPDPPSRLLLHPIPLSLPSAPALSTCLMHPTWAGDLWCPQFYWFVSCDSIFVVSRVCLGSWHLADAQSMFQADPAGSPGLPGEYWALYSGRRWSCERAGSKTPLQLLKRLGAPPPGPPL